MNMSFAQILILVTALSLDAFAASFVYGTDNVKIPAASMAILTALSTGILLVSLLLGKWIGFFLTAGTAKAICFLLLFLLGLIKLFDSTLKSAIRKSGLQKKKMSFSFSNLNFILTVYADPAIVNKADISVLSPSEAASLGIALSLDSAAAGMGAGMMVLHLPLILLLSILSNMAAILSGSYLGRAAAGRMKADLSWLSGLLLMVLAFSKLL